MQTPKIDACDRLIVALDLSDVEEAKRMVAGLEGVVKFYKIGLILQLAPGIQDFIESLIRDGKKLFLDYKYYDIPQTLKKAVARAARLGVSFLTVHGSGKAIRGALEGRGSTELKIFTVTVLTSMDAADISEMGYTQHNVEDLVVVRAKKALAAGCDGVIASGREAKLIKDISGGNLLVVTPGIRPDGYPEDDQQRKTTPRQAILSGADYLVIGRPITEEVDPRAAATTILKEMQSAFDDITASTKQQSHTPV
jgi:orotidine-5'-phosphate decarboxylase